MLVSGRVVEMPFFFRHTPETPKTISLNSPNISGRHLKWRVHPHRDMSCMDTAYVRGTPPPKKIAFSGSGFNWKNHHLKPQAINFPWKNAHSHLVSVVVLKEVYMGSLCETSQGVVWTQRSNVESISLCHKTTSSTKISFHCFHQS